MDTNIKALQDMISLQEKMLQTKDDHIRVLQESLEVQKDIINKLLDTAEPDLKDRVHLMAEEARMAGYKLTGLNLVKQVNNRAQTH